MDGEGEEDEDEWGNGGGMGSGMDEGYCPRDGDLRHGRGGAEDDALTCLNIPKYQ